MAPQADNEGRVIVWMSATVERCVMELPGQASRIFGCTKPLTCSAVHISVALRSRAMRADGGDTAAHARYQRLRSRHRSRCFETLRRKLRALQLSMNFLRSRRVSRAPQALATAVDTVIEEFALCMWRE